MTMIVAMLLVGIVPYSPVVEERVDLVETNHYYDYKGDRCFIQIIWWGWDKRDDSHHVIAWRFLKHPHQAPSTYHDRAGCVTIWQDGEILRAVRGGRCYTTWTQHDPEVADREHLPTSQRQNLARIR